MKSLLIILFIFWCFLNPVLIRGFTYELAFGITGSAKGRILLIFPYRIFYNAEASLLFDTSIQHQKGDIFKLTTIEKPGFMMRTLGFSGRSLAILTADNDKVRGKSYSIELMKEFRSRAPEYSKYIKNYYWNNFTFRKTRNAISFIRDKNGINRNMRYDLWLKRSPGEKPVMISFNIYRILNEIINAYNHSFLPENSSISIVMKGPEMKWTSGDIDFSEPLARSALYSAGIFRKLKPLKQERTFRADYSSSLSDNSYLIIKGSAEPDVSIWGSFRIRKFERIVKIRKKDHVLISDSMVISVMNNSGKGGRVRTDIILKE